MLRIKKCLLVSVLLMAVMMSSSVVWADLKQADVLFGQAMESFNQNKYMQAMPLFGRMMGALPTTGAHVRRAKSLFYIGLCYHRMARYEKHAVGAWKRFLLEVKKIPGANKQPDWSSKIQLVKAAIDQYKHPVARRAVPARRTPPNRQKNLPIKRQHFPNGTTSGVGQNHPDPGGFKHRPKSVPSWLASLRRCLRVRENSLKGKLQRLKKCRSQMPGEEMCASRCQSAKGRVTEKIERLRSVVERNRTGRTNRNRYSSRQNFQRRNPNRGNQNGWQSKPRRATNPGAFWISFGTVTMIVGVGVGVVGGGLWFYGNELEKDRDHLLKKVPSVSTTTEVVNKNEELTGINTGTVITVLTAAVLVSAGYWMTTTGRRMLLWRRQRRHVSQSSKPPREHRVTLFSSSGDLP